MILMIDNYDSFTYNIVQYFGELKAPMTVFRNDAIKVKDIEKMKPERIVISPGPGSPERAGISVELIRVFAGKIPILGVCLGHQAIGYAFGGTIVGAKKIMHGKISSITHNDQDIFAGLSNPFTATRYHSLAIEETSMPDCLEATAWAEDHEIMGVRHKTMPVWGVQFHPESILTKQGMKIFENFLSL
jgi:anthranilate synthase component 2